MKIKNELKEKYKKMQLIKELNVLPRNMDIQLTLKVVMYQYIMSRISGKGGLTSL